MQRNNWERSRVHVHYSPTAFDSYGVVVEHFNEEEQLNLNLQWNRLLYRKNQKNSQANLYLKSHLGVAFLDKEESFNSSLSLAADWETRRWFTSYEAELRYLDEGRESFFQHRGRVGLAPYLADYGSIHTWLMLQVDHNPEAREEENQLILTPLVRFLRGDYLLELGVNSNGDALANCIIRF